MAKWLSMASAFESATDLVHHTHQVLSGEVTLHVQSLQRRGEAAGDILLLSEAEAPSSRWPSGLLIGLARRVGRCIWFDTRDVGASTWTEEPYSLNDLVADARAVIDALALGAVDVLGRSMGGEIAMRLALEHPQSVRSLLLFSTTPGRREELGLPAEWLIEKMSNRLLSGAPVEAGDRARWLVDQWEWFSGPVFPFDREAALVRAHDEISAGWRGPNGHGAAVMEADDIVDDLRTLRVPTSIVHGTADPVLPLEHCRALHLLIENSTLTLIEGLGHELPDTFVDQLVELASRMAE